jgi:hypothetical protein
MPSTVRLPLFPQVWKGLWIVKKSPARGVCGVFHLWKTAGR